MAALTDGFVPQPTHVSPSPTSYSSPSSTNLAAVVTTVALVGILMAVLITWLFLRLRHPDSRHQSIPVAIRPTSYVFRPSFAPSEASSKFGFIRKPLRLSRKTGNGSWDFADPDPLPQKESPLDPPPRCPSQKHRPAPLAPAPAYSPLVHRASTYKDDMSPRTPTSPADAVELPPPAYIRESTPRLTCQPKDLPPS